MKERKTPIRTCVACREEAGKKELIRLVKSAEGVVEIDLSGKKPGRGAYIHALSTCLMNAIKSKKLDRALRMAVSAGVIQELEQAVRGSEQE